MKPRLRSKVQRYNIYYYKTVILYCRLKRSYIRNILQQYNILLITKYHVRQKWVRTTEIPAEGRMTTVN